MRQASQTPHQTGACPSSSTLQATFKNLTETSIFSQQQVSASWLEVCWKKCASPSRHLLIIDVGVWPAVGGSILVAIFNGGPPGVIYEFIVVSIFYWAVAASLAELASAIPSSAGVYHWASVTAGTKWGRIVG